jgi:hypothetical protein
MPDHVLLGKRPAAYLTGRRLLNPLDQRGDLGADRIDADGRPQIGQHDQQRLSFQG